MAKRVVVYNERGRKEYDGPDRRPSFNFNQGQMLLGVSIEGWVKLVVYIGGVLIFGNTYLIKTDLRMKLLEDSNMVLTSKLTEASQSLKDYMEASDGFNSSIYGTQFKGGRPIDGSFRKHIPR